MQLYASGRCSTTYPRLRTPCLRMKAGLPVPIRVAEHPAPALPGGKVAKSLTWRMLPGRIAGPHPLLVDPGFATLVVANESVSEPGPNSNAKPAGLTPDRLAEWLHLGRFGQVDGGDSFPLQLGHELT